MVDRKILFAAAFCASFWAGQAAQAATCGKTVWAPSNQESCSVNGTILRDNQANSIKQPTSKDDRKHCVKLNGQTVTQYVQYPNSYVSLMDYRKAVASSDRAQISVDMMVDKNYKFWTGGRVALGLYSGTPGKSVGCIGGGCLPKDQQGTSIRLQYQYKDGCFRLSMYDYALNRNTKQGEHVSNWENETSKESQFGRNTWMSQCIPLGKMVTVTMEMDLNSFDSRGKPLANGVAVLSARDKATGKVLGSVKRSDMILAKVPAWKVLGPYFTDKPHLHKRSPNNLNAMYFSGYKMETNCK